MAELVDILLLPVYGCLRIFIWVSGQIRSLAFIT